MTNSKKMLSMVAQIGRGVRKQDSHLVTDSASSQLWDELAADHTRMLAENPGAEVTIPNDPDIF